ncbi:MAG TPA: 30S ribosomal protein S17e [Candidatus Nanoarchaeia archaeon]|nr:30S ribosomal protein S17e [Candidatus Nanoarchaeia archaeon]
MGRIKTTLTRRVGDDLIERYGDKLGTDFDANQEVIPRLASIASKKMLNVIAGYITREMCKKKAAEQ